MIAALLQAARPDISIQGVDVLARAETRIPVVEFDGESLPYEANSFDVVTLVDVLHHTVDPLILLREAVRVARQDVIIKDHTREGLLAGVTLRFMDRTGNRRHGVELPYNYWRREQWARAFNSIGAEVRDWNQQIHLYWWPASLLFDRSLHFVARLNTRKQSTAMVEEIVR